MGSDGGFRRPLAVLVLAIAALFATAASAGASSIGPITNVSYASAHVNARVTATGVVTTWSIEHSTDGTTWSSGPVHFIIAGSGDVPESEDVGGLKGGTRYFVRLAVNGVPAAPTSPPYPEFTTLAVEPPTILAVDNPASVFSTSVTATGKVKRPANTDPAFDVNCRFEYVTDAQFTATGFQSAAQAPCEQNPVTAASVNAGGEMSVSAEVGRGNSPALTPSTTYHLRLVAENAAPDFVTQEAPSTFTTQPPVAKPTILSVHPPNPSEHGATLSAEVERPAGADPALNTSCRFEYISDSQFKQNEEVNSLPGFEGAVPAPCIENPILSPGPGHPTVAVPVSVSVGGYYVIEAGTTYHFRFAAENGGGTVTETPGTFTTLPLAIPDMVVDPPSAGYTKAAVTATVNPHGCNDNGYVGGPFQYSTEPSNPDSWINSNVEVYLAHDYGTETDTCKTNTPQPVGGTIEGLHPGTTYAIRLFASNGVDINVPSPYVEFTTKGTSTPPGVTFDPVSAIVTTGATFSGMVDTNAPAGPLDEEAEAAYETEWHFECTPDCPGLSGTVKADEGSKAISVDVSRLEANTFYEAKLIAHNAVKTVETALQTFSTPLVAPEVKANPGGSAGKGSYNVGGLVTPFNTKISNCHFAYGPTTEYVYSAPCSPDPVGRNEVQKVYVPGAEGEFRLSFRGQTTEDIKWGASASVVEHELEALTAIGPGGVSDVKFEEGFVLAMYTIHFNGPLAATNVGPLHAEQGTEELYYGGAPAGSPTVENLVDGGNNAPVVVEAHLTGLTPGATYHYQLFATNSRGTFGSGDQAFLSPVASDEQGCPNEAIRTENSSAALPECRSYELVTSAFKASSGVELQAVAGEESIGYLSRAGNINNSGFGGVVNKYVANRGTTGWETLANLNGPRGSPYAPPTSIGSGEPFATSPDLLRSLWNLSRGGGPTTVYVRQPDGGFEQVSDISLGLAEQFFAGASADFSHTIWNGVNGSLGEPLGPGVYEFIGAGHTTPPIRIDVDNAGLPVSDCPTGSGFGNGSSTASEISEDGSVIYFRARGCPGGSIQNNQVWARVDETTSYEASASRCTRMSGDPGGACNAPADSLYEGSATDGSRVFFTTTQQLVNGDTDEGKDLYAYTLPETALNPGSAPSLIDVSGSGSNAKVQEIVRISNDGSTVYFLADGVLADNHDALDEPAVAGDHNLYVWRQTASHPEGETKFIGRLTSSSEFGGYVRLQSETTPDGGYLAFRSYTPMVPTDTDNAADIYRYDAAAGELTRISVDTSGVGGNADGLDAEFPINPGQTHPTISNDGRKMVFFTSEALSSNDGNGASDVYMWSGGRTSLITTGAVGGGGGTYYSQPRINGSGHDIYFTTTQELTADDVDNVSDVYDARIDGGFSFAAGPPCSGEGCQSSGSRGTGAPRPATEDASGTANHQRGTVSVEALSASERAKLIAGSRAELELKVSGPGRVSVVGTAQIGSGQKRVFASKRSAVQAGEVAVPITLSKAAQTRLAQGGSLKIRLLANFADAMPSSSTLTLSAPQARRSSSKRKGG